MTATLDDRVTEQVAEQMRDVLIAEDGFMEAEALRDVLGVATPELKAARQAIGAKAIPSRQPPHRWWVVL